MFHINESDFRRIDLNLLIVFSALMRERSVSGAARRLFLGQPAVSASLKRLRYLFKDELFVRSGRGMEPTVRALDVEQQIGPSLMAIHNAIARPGGFDPATARHTFRLRMPDATEVALLPALMAAFSKQAPGCRLIVSAPIPGISPQQAIESDEVDLAITPLSDVPSSQSSQAITDILFVCLFDGERLGVTAPISMDNYLAYPHLLTTFNGELEGFVDARLRPMGLSREVVLGTAHFGTLPLVLKRTDTIATLPMSSAEPYARQFGLTVSPLPFDVEPVSVSLLWSARADRDPAMMWLRQTIVDCVEESFPSGNKPIIE